MAKITDIKRHGVSGSTYPFEVYKYGDDLDLDLGEVVYLLLKYDKELRKYIIMYVGQTEDLKQRFSGHHKKREFKSHGCNRIGIHQISGETKRLKAEMDIMRKYRPLLNDQPL